MVCAADRTALRGGKETARTKGGTCTATGDAGLAIATGIGSAAPGNGIDTEKNFATRAVGTGD